MHTNSLLLLSDTDNDVQPDNNTDDDFQSIYLESSTDSPESFDEIGHPHLARLPYRGIDPSADILTPIFTAQSFAQTLKTLLAAALPFCTSRLAVSVQGVGYAYLMGQFGSVAISAGPLISGLQNALVTPLRSGLVAINVLVPGMHQPRQIGRLVQQTYASTILLTIPTVAILLNAGAMLRAIGTDTAVAAEVQRYMNGYAWGILPIFGLVIDQQLSLAIGKRGVATLIGLLYASLVLVTGYVLTTYVPGNLYQNTYGLGLGFSITAWLMTLSLKVFFMLHPDYQPYQLFNFHHFFKNIKKNITNLLSISLPLWLQSLSESFNLMAISILMSRISNDELMAEQVSLQWMTALSPVILALANVTCSITSKLFGLYIRTISRTAHDTGVVMLHEQEGQTSIQILQQLGRQTLASLVLAGSVGVIFASLFLTIPRALTRLFVPASGDSHQDQTIEALSTAMLHTNSIGILTDSFRITLTGNLLGARDATIPATVSFLLISGLGLLIGGISTEIFGFSGDSLFVVRNLFIIAATLAIGARWFIYRDNLSTVALSSAPVHLPVMPHAYQVSNVSINGDDTDLAPVDDLHGLSAVVASSDLPSVNRTVLVVGNQRDLTHGHETRPTNSGLTQYGSFFRDPGTAPVMRIETTAGCAIC